MTAQQRLEAYEWALKLLTDEYWAGQGVCRLLKTYCDEAEIMSKWHFYYSKIDQYFPEFYAQKPADRAIMYSWWPWDDTGTVARIQAVENAIELVKLKIESHESTIGSSV